MSWLLGGMALLGILLGAELFTNALEHLGERYGLSEGAVGSVFAAVGTALPEALVPVVALFAGGGIAVGQAVSVGAILGAPLMISTLSFGLLGVFMLLSGRRHLHPERKGLARDLGWFQALFGLGAAALFIPPGDHRLRLVASLLLLTGYAAYLWATLRRSGALVAEGHGASADQPLYTARLWGGGLVQIWSQLLLGVGLIVWAAHGFVAAVEQLAISLGLSVLVLSLLVVPVATELPEKVNSLLWARRGKDTLALGNLSGALVFQGSLLPALGLWLTPWQPSRPVVYAAGLTLLAATWLRFANRPGGLKPAWLLLNAACYAAYFYLLTAR
ncbi:sodium:calcium antiporter [Acidihalobacter prosperus]|uniref:Sulfate transporter, CysZ-type n=1 Tax=Acidihalobacter prosperus TaxID=160660 RepID=A0A1A6C7Y1_9GAMM|nr:hypothetical protein [Acidihalobacter prosperus]OBS10654.1 Sulfate transporter, CysZ-type [Acidihalobacter prosperus]